MPVTTDQIVSRYHERKKALGPTINRMMEMRDAYNGDLLIPLPELDRTERPAVANLISQGVDQTAQRVASTLPDVDCAPLRPGIQLSEERSQTRRQAILSWWSMNKLSLIQRHRARYLISYAAAPVLIRPDPTRKIPVWEQWNPMSAFPAPGNELTPSDCILTFSRTVGWLRAHYPNHHASLRLPPNSSPDDRVDLLRYIDAETFALIVLGRADDNNPLYSDAGNPPVGIPQRGAYIELERLENRTGLCTVVFPGRITLDRLQGQFDALIGIYWQQAKLMALETIAVQRSIFPEQWLVDRPGEVGQVITLADGLSGEIGHVKGGVLDTVQVNPGVQTYPTLDRLERAMRLSGGIPAEFGGESGNNIRTARRGAAVLSSAVDFPIQEYQELLAASLEEENIRAIAIEKTYFSESGKRSFYYSWKGEKGRADYDPLTIWETDQNTVSYSFPGSDINQLIIGTGQRVGMGTMSKRTGMQLDPLVDDPLWEENQIIAEGLQSAFLQGLQTQAAQGALAPSDLARIAQLVVEERKPLYSAVQQAQAEAQERQAAVEGAQGPAAPADPNSPEAQMGLTPSSTAPAGQAIPQNAQPSMGALADLLGNLRRPQMTLSSEG